MAAIHAVTMLLSSGDHIVAGADIYGGTYRLIHKIVNRSGITVTLVDTTDPHAVETAINNATKLLWIENPGNPLLSTTDIAACAAIARKRSVLVAVDSTFATPALTRPLELGADIVMHSATADAAAGARRRYRNALCHQIHWRPQ
jgi:cystathionine beta-lyase/cystathionine gamma-synthase